MGLQVWLPLTKDTNNYGVSSSKITVSTATLDSSGKLGGCYNFASNKYMGLDEANVNNHKYTNISLACWAYFTATDSTERYIIGCWESGGGGLAWQNQEIDFILYAGGAYRTLWTPTTLTLNTWHHICGTYDGKNMLLYINGELVGTLAVNAALTYHATCPWEIGGNPSGAAFVSGNLPGKLNDVRIYDHALSAKEVEEIAKGLVVHYKLDDAYAESTTNLSNVLSNTFFNASRNKYGYNADSNFTKITGVFQNRTCEKVYGLVGGGSEFPYTHISGMFVSDGGSYPKYKTVSFDYWTNTPMSDPFINIYKLGSGSATTKCIIKNSTGTFTYTGTGSASESNMKIVANEWNHVEYTMCGTTTEEAHFGYCRNGPAITNYNTDIYWLFANIQVEEKDHATPYTPTSRTATTVYDVSGLGNNGTINGTLSTNSDTARYTASTVFATGNNHIALPSISYTGMANSYTFSWWEYNISAGSVMFWGFNNGNRLNVFHSGGGLYWNTGDGTSNPFKTDAGALILCTEYRNSWHHYTVTGDGITTKLYIDGEYKGKATTYQALTGTKIYINGWDNSTSYTMAGGKESDFRIYATALTAEQIKELYNTSASVANNGTFFAREFIE